MLYDYEPATFPLHQQVSKYAKIPSLGNKYSKEKKWNKKNQAEEWLKMLIACADIVTDFQNKA